MAGIAVSLFCAAITGVLAIAALAGYSFLGTTSWSLVDASIFAALAFGISRRSKFAAMAAPMFYLAERLYAWGTTQPPSTLGGIISIIFLLAFVNAARGVLGFHRLKQATPIETQSA